ncbi:MAG: T9SS type A sorting domain-containing protein [Bacteroidales bacterium]|nr:T9SS type A sorting domain-containing protein [Bacteroidales bacterium]
MKFPFVLVLILVFAFNRVDAQFTWGNPFPHGNRINDIAIFEDNILMTVADFGSAYSTGNFIDWYFNNLEYETVKESIKGFSFVNNETGYAVGTGGLIMKYSSSEGGWRTTYSNTQTNLNSVYFTDESVGYMAGYKGIILKTTDGCDTVFFLESGTTQTLNKILFLNSDTGIVVGEKGTVLRTLNAGGNWTKIETGTNKTLFDIYFATKSVGYIVGNVGIILKTTDGGSTWSDISYELNDLALQTIVFSHPDTGIVAGKEGYVLFTQNGGGNWEPLNSYSIADISSSCKKDSIIYLAGDFGSIISCTNWGQVWMHKTQLIVRSMQKVRLLNDMLGFAVGGDPFNNIGILMRTQGSPTKWEAAAEFFESINDLAVIDSDTLYLAGNNGTIYKTTDGGTHFNTLYGPMQKPLFAIGFSSPSTGFAVGFGGTFLKTTNYGVTWNTMPGITNENLYSIYFNTNGDCYITGDGGTILKSTDDSTFSHLSSGTGVPLYDIEFLNESLGFVVGYNGSIRKTTDGGESWDLLITDYTTALHGIEFPSNNTGYICGDGGLIIKTTDGGQTWKKFRDQFTSNNLYGLNFLDEQTGVLAGSGGTILFTDNGGGPLVSGILNPVADEPNNLKIYPNPTSGPFWIEYELKDRAPVQMIVYDLSGRVVDVIKNFDVLQGTIREQVNLENYKSGIYLISIRTEQFNETKKLILR